MSLRDELQRILSVLAPLSIITGVYLYLYPVFQGCAFPAANPESSTTSPSARFSPGFIDTVRDHIGLPPEPTSHSRSAPFRLLVLADPQLEGDTSLPFPEYELGNRIISHWNGIVSANSTSDRLLNIGKSLTDLVVGDIPRSIRAAHKRLDLFGNDFYLAHIYRTLRWWTKPTHITVLGDLIGSQWVSDEEFKIRSRRYWHRVFKGGVRVDDNITATGSPDYKEGKVELRRLNDSSWSNRIINIAGNHDVGYAGDITEERIARFDREFGRANWDIRFHHPATNRSEVAPDGSLNPTLHLVVINSLSFDAPALTQSVQSYTYSFLNDLITHRSYPVEDRTSFTLLLTHLPLHKKEGVCTDAPHFSFYEEDDEEYPEDGVPRFKAGGLQEQNHMSDYVTNAGILQGIFGMSGDRSVPAGGWGRNGLILTGHDHTGCDVVHYVDRNATQKEPEEESADKTQDWSWDARRYSRSAATSDLDNDSPSVREVTLRSMMGEFGGNAGLLSLWFDFDPAVREWKYEITMCPLGAQHGWWAVHALGIVTVLTFLAWISMPFVQSIVGTPKKTTSSHSTRKENERSRTRSGKTEARSLKPPNGKSDSKRSQRRGNSRRRN